MRSRKHDKRSNSTAKRTQSVPEPEVGVNRIQMNGDVPIFQLILGQHISNTDEKAIWVDSGNEASTYALSSAGNPELLDRVEIGRAFTAFQHYHIVNRIEQFLDSKTKYLILPNIDQQYKTGNISEKEMKDLFSTLVDKIEAIRDERPEIKILYSLFDTRPHEINTVLEGLTENKIEIKKNSQGLRINSNSNRQLVYNNKGFVQTTISFWKRKRHENPENTVKVEYNGKNKQYL